MATFAIDGGSAVTTNTTGSWVVLETFRPVQIEVAGTFNGATVTFETLAVDGVTAVPVTDSSGSVITFSTTGQKGVFYVSTGEKMRYTTSGGGASMSLRITVKEVVV